MPQAHIYSLITLLFLGFFYINIFYKFTNKKILYSIILAFTIYSIGNAFFIQSIWDYPSVPSSIKALIIIIFSILYFHKTMVEAKIEKLFHEPLIWINTAILFYFTGTLFFYILFNINLEFSVPFTKVTIFYLKISNVLLYILVSIGFWKSKKASIKR